MNSADQLFMANIQKLARLGGEPMTQEQADLLTRYCRMLQKWNEKMNLTAVTDDDGIAVKHIQDSLTVLPIMDALMSARSGQFRIRFIDIGSGAGLPGLPLLVMRPQWQGVLLDSLAKRIRFLETVIQELGLTHATAVHARAEDAGRQAGLRDRFDLAIARAVAPLNVLVEYCLPFVRVNGVFVAMKGKTDQEWPQAKRAVQLMGGQLETIKTFTLPGTDQHRSLFCIRKVEPTLPMYPRKAGMPEKKPL